MSNLFGDVMDSAIYRIVFVVVQHKARFMSQRSTQAGIGGHSMMQGDFRLVLAVRLLKMSNHFESFRFGQSIQHIPHTGSAFFIKSQNAIKLF